MEFSDRLRELRKEKHLTQKELAQYLGLTANSICEWENHRSEPSISSLIKMSVLFETSIGYLIGSEDDFGQITIQSSAPTYSLEERKLIEDYRGLSRPLKDMLQNLIQTWQQGTNAETVPAKGRK